MENFKYSKRDIGIYLMSSLTEGLYEDPLIAIREYVQNSYDAEAERVFIHFSETEGEIKIIDDGIGFSDPKKLLGIGVSYKDNRKAGFRGIGIWSGINISKKIVIITNPKDSKESLKVVINTKNIKNQIETHRPLTDVLEESIEINSSNEKIASNFNSGTEVRLKIDNEYLDSFDKEEIKEYISWALPVPFHKDFKYRKRIEKKLKENVEDYRTIDIRFEGEKIYRPYTNKLDEPSFSIIKDENDKYAYLWYCPWENYKKIKERGKEYLNKNIIGIKFRKLNITVGNSSNVEKLWKSGFLSKWVTGDIYVINKNIKPNTQRNGFEDNPYKKKMMELLKEKFKEIEKNHLREYSERRRHKKKANKAIEYVNRKLPKIKKMTEADRRITKRELDHHKKKLEEAYKKLPSKEKKDEIEKTIKSIDKYLKDNKIEIPDIEKLEEVKKDRKDVKAKKTPDKEDVFKTYSKETREVLRKIIDILDKECKKKLFKKIIKKIESELKNYEEQ